MSFKNSFDTKKSEYSFKGTLTYERFNNFFKQPSLVNYSIVNTLINYYNKFETTKVLEEISLYTEDSDMQKFLDNSLKNLMYKTLFDKVIIRDMLVENVNNAISFKLEKPLYNINNQYEILNDVKINVEWPLYTEFNSDTGINLCHKNYRESSVHCGLDGDINSLWGQTIKIPELKVEENGHISDYTERTFTMPNPMETLKEKILEKTNIGPGYSTTLNLDSNEHVLIMLYYNYNKNNVNETLVTSKILTTDMLSYCYNYSLIIFESNKTSVVSSYAGNASFFFKIKYNDNYYVPNKKTFYIEFLKSIDGATSNYNAYGFKNFWIEVYTLTSS